ncbi:MAG: hypothetical protein H7A23_17800 [Leptospiraceae bacterium]|nr:hypothetical protein [Leptospiraceae bacterium]
MLLIFLPIGFYYFYIATIVENAPFWDDFELIRTFLEHQKSDSLWEQFKILISQHNEHRILLVRLFMLFYSWFFAEINFARLTTIGNLFLLWALFIFLKNQHKFTSNLWVCIPVSFLIFNIQFWESGICFSYSIQNFGSFTLALASIYCIANNDSWKSFFLSQVLLFFSVFTMANGFIAAIVVVVLFLFTGRKQKAIVSGSILGLMLFLYFSDYYSIHSPKEPLNPFRLVKYIFVFLGSGFTMGYPKLKVFAAIIGAMVLVFYCICLWQVKKKRIDVFLFAALSFLIGSAVAASIGRYNFGSDQALASRYTFFSLMTISTVYLLLIQTVSSKLLKFIVPSATFVAVTICCLSYNNLYDGVRHTSFDRLLGLEWWSISGQGLPYEHKERASSYMKQFTNAGFFRVEKSILETQAKNCELSFNKYPIKQQMEFAIDQLEGSLEYALIQGWTFPKSSKKAFKNFCIGLQANNEIFLLKNAQVRKRFDIVKHFGEKELLNSGFFLVIDKSLLQKGKEYQIILFGKLNETIFTQILDNHSIKN